MAEGGLAWSHPEHGSAGIIVRLEAINLRERGGGPVVAGGSKTGGKVLLMTHEGIDCISTECQSSVFGEKRGGPLTAKDSLRLSAMGGESSRPESIALLSRILSSRTLLSSSKNL